MTPDEPSKDPADKAHLAEITAAVETAIHRLDERDKANDAVEKSKAEHKEQLASRVSMAALASSWFGQAGTRRER